MAWPRAEASACSAGVSHQLCSATFVSKVDPESYYRQALVPDLAFLAPYLRHDIDRAKGQVTASLWGQTSRAVYRGAEGCLVVQGPVRPPAPAAPAPAAPPLLPPIAGLQVVAPTDPALVAVLDHAFAEPAEGGPRLTKAVVIVHDGKIVAERYAPGYGIGTPQHGWSLSKSITNALLGVLVRQGRLSMSGPAPVAAWADPADPRHAISLDDMLRMKSGLDFGQSLDQDWTVAFDPTTQMMFARPDTAVMAEKASMNARPGMRFRYSNGNTQLLSRIIRDQAGGDAASVIAFAHHELFDKLGMTGVTMELDAVGTPLGGSHFWATARDWARFGLLYLDDGVVGGERILPAGWVDYSARLTPGSERYGYGAGFWTNRGEPLPTRKLRADMPKDSFFGSGSLGQYVVIAPSQRLVIVRLGPSREAYGATRALDELTAEAVAALKGKG
jgi:CubicO group peptidase (beta-lactamase class C family)